MGGVGWDGWMPLGCHTPMRVCEGLQKLEFTSRVTIREDVSSEGDSHLPTFIGLSSLKNHVTMKISRYLSVMEILKIPQTQLSS